MCLPILGQTLSKCASTLRRGYTSQCDLERHRNCYLARSSSFYDVTAETGLLLGRRIVDSEERLWRRRTCLPPNQSYSRRPAENHLFRCLRSFCSTAFDLMAAPRFNVVLDLYEQTCIRTIKYCRENLDHWKFLKICRRGAASGACWCAIIFFCYI